MNKNDIWERVRSHSMGVAGEYTIVECLAILPGTAHYAIFTSPALQSSVIPFLEAPWSNSDLLSDCRRQAVFLPATTDPMDCDNL